MLSGTNCTKEKMRRRDYYLSSVYGYVQLHSVSLRSSGLLTQVLLKVDYSFGPSGTSSYEIGNPQRFGQDFVNQVANPRDIVQFHRKNVGSGMSSIQSSPFLVY